MTLKMLQVLNLTPVFSGLKDKKLPIKTLYKLSKLMEAVEKEKQFYTEALNKVIQEYSEKDDQGNPVITEQNDGIILRQDCLDIAQEKFKELWDIDCNLPDITFSLDELESADVTLEIFNLLMPFIKE